MSREKHRSMGSAVRRRLGGALAVVALLLVALPATAGTGRYWSEDRPYYVDILNKFGRGLWNIAVAPTEIYTQAYKEGLRASIHGDTVTDVSVGTTTGGLVGVGTMFVRVGVGAFDLVTFPWPTRPWIRPATPAIYLEDVPPASIGVDLPESHR